MRRFRNCYNLILLIIVAGLFPCKEVCLQQAVNWVDISLVDTIKYMSFGVENIENYRYPPSHLFDADFHTCWVSRLEENEENPSIFIRLPDSEKITVNIFPGYGKSKELFVKNSRPGKVKFSVFAAVNPDGFVSEYGALYKAVEFPWSKVISFADSFGIQSVTLDFSQQDLSGFRNKVNQKFDSDFKLIKASTCLILKMEILEAWKGTKYNDICISEIFFKDRFISAPIGRVNEIEKVYLNTAQNTLLLDEKARTGIVAYCDTLSVLQLIEVTQDKKWAILISMPAEIEGRVETYYLLLDLLNREVVNAQLEKCTGSYISGSMIYFETGENNRQYLIYSTKDEENCKVELR